MIWRLKLGPAAFQKASLRDAFHDDDIAPDPVEEIRTEEEYLDQNIARKRVGIILGTL